MMKQILLVLTLANALRLRHTPLTNHAISLLEQTQKETPGGGFTDKNSSRKGLAEPPTTLREWLKESALDGGFQLAMVPQFNNQHSVFGMLEALREERLLAGLKGITSVSGNTLPGSHIAAGQTGKRFKESFPKDGWAGMGPTEPKIERDYRQFLGDNLPKNFEDLKVPLVVSLTQWRSEKDLRSMNVKHAKPLFMNAGNLHDTMVAAVASGSINSMAFGFHPQELAGHYPVGDGGPTDPWGVKGLAMLPKNGSSRLLHILSVDYPEQWKALKPDQVPTKPQSMMTVNTVQTPTATHSFLLHKFGQKQITLRSAHEWNELMFKSSYDEMKRKLDEPIEMDHIGNSVHGILNHDPTERYEETPSEKMFDSFSALQRDAIWAKVLQDGGHGSPWKGQALEGPTGFDDYKDPDADKA